MTSPLWVLTSSLGSCESTAVIATTIQGHKAKSMLTVLPHKLDRAGLPQATSCKIILGPIRGLLGPIVKLNNISSSGLGIFLHTQAQTGVYR